MVSIGGTYRWYLQVVSIGGTHRWYLLADVQFACFVMCLLMNKNDHYDIIM